MTKVAAVCLAFAMVLAATACGKKENGSNLLAEDNVEKREVILFSPMEKTEADTFNTARNATDKTVIMAEEELGVRVSYVTYTAENYQDKTYDDVTMDRARNNMDDIYLLNPDTIQALGEEGRLMDLSGLASAENLRDVVKTANVVNGKLVAIPQEVVAYGLISMSWSCRRHRRSSWNVAGYLRRMESRHRWEPTGGGLRLLFWPRLLRIYTTEEIRRQRLPL